MADPVAYKYQVSSGQNLITTYWSSVFIGLTGPSVQNFSEPYIDGKLNFRNGIQATGGFNYVLYSDEYNQGLGIEEADSLAVGWTCSSDQGSLLSLINKIPERFRQAEFGSYQEAIEWLISQNKYFLVNKSYPSIAYNNKTMVAAYDPTYLGCYPDVGNFFYDLSGISTSPAQLENGAEISGLSYFNFDEGLSQYANIPSGVLSTLVSTNNFECSISIWFKSGSIPSGGSNYTIFQLSASSGSPNPDWFRLFINDAGELYSTYTINQKDNFTDDILNVTVGAWYHFVVTISLNKTSGKTGVTYYINGSFLSGSVHNLVTPPFTFDGVEDYNHLFAAASSSGAIDSSSYLRGSIGSFYIYSGILDSSEVSKLYYETNFY